MAAVLAPAVHNTRRLRLCIILCTATFLPGCNCSSSTALRQFRDSAVVTDGEPGDVAALDSAVGFDTRPDGPPDIAIDEASGAEPDSRNGASRLDSPLPIEALGEVAGSGFRSARISSLFALCPATLDCESYIDISADGTLRVDKENDLTHTVFSAQVSAADMEAALAILTNPDLLALLQGPPGCEFTPDAFVDMTLEIGDLSVVASIANCTQQPIVAANEMLRALQQSYLP